MSLALVVLAGTLAACGGSTASHHPKATPTVTLTPAPKGWSTAPSPAVGQEGDLRAVTTLSASDGWAVGQYEGLDSLQRTLTERWNGSQWTYQPSPSPGQQYNLLQAVAGSSAGDVWAVGYETGADAQDQPLIEHWDGTSWRVIPSPVAGSAGGQLTGVTAVSASDAWAVGFIPNPGPAGQYNGQQPLIEHWNGSAWSIAKGAAIPLPSDGSTPTNSLAAVVALSANNAWAVGGDNSAENTGMQALIEHWDGHAWTLVQGDDPNSNGNALSGIAAVSSNDIWAVGSGSLSGPLGCGFATSSVIEHWNGARWSSVAAPQPDSTQGAFSLAGVAATSAQDVWAVGAGLSYNATNRETIAPVVERWNGSQWSLVSSPAANTSHGLTGVAAAGGSILTVGQYEAANGPGATLAEQESGGQLSLAASASPGTLFNTLHGVASISPNDVWAVGNSAAGTLAEHWNGAAWAVATTPNAAPYSDSLNGVAAASTTDVWAVGQAGTAAIIERWDGNHWATVSAPAPQDSMLSGVVALSASNAWAVGGSGGSGPLVEHWNGTKWSAVATPTSAPGTFLSSESLLAVAAASPNDIWAVGGNPPHNCGGQLPALIEHWNGSSWSVIPNLPQGVLYGAAAVSASDVWAVGSGGNGVLIEHWNGKQWSTVTSPAPAAHTYPLLQSVAAHGAADVWAVGSAYGASGGMQVAVLHWDGHAWSAVQVAAPGVADNSLYGVTATASGELWAVGEYDDCTGCGATQALIERYHP